MHPSISGGRSPRQDNLRAGTVRLVIIYETTDDLPDANRAARWKGFLVSLTR
jgi:hypothetical protein